MPVTWEVVEQEIYCGNRACSAAVCRENPNFPVGVLSDMDRQIISTHLDTLRRKNSAGLTIFLTGFGDGTTDTILALPESTLHFSKPERKCFTRHCFHVETESGVKSNINSRFSCTNGL